MDGCPIIVYIDMLQGNIFSCIREGVAPVVFYAPVIFYESVEFYENIWSDRSSIHLIAFPYFMGNHRNIMTLPFSLCYNFYVFVREILRFLLIMTEKSDIFVVI